MGLNLGAVSRFFSRTPAPAPEPHPAHQYPRLAQAIELEHYDDDESIEERAYRIAFTKAYAKLRS